MAPAAEEHAILSNSQTRIDEVIGAGAKRLLERADNPRRLDASALVPRVRATVEKYVLKHERTASAERSLRSLTACRGRSVSAIACQSGGISRVE